MTIFYDNLTKVIQMTKALIGKRNENLKDSGSKLSDAIIIAFPSDGNYVLIVFLHYHVTRSI